MLKIQHIIYNGFNTAIMFCWISIVIHVFLNAGYDFILNHQEKLINIIKVVFELLIYRTHNEFESK